MPHICVAPHWLDWSPALGPRSALGSNTGAQRSQAGWGAAASLHFDQGDFRTSHPNNIAVDHLPQYMSTK